MLKYCGNAMKEIFQNILAEANRPTLSPGRTQTDSSDVRFGVEPRSEHDRFNG